jgi:hypothetical protein
MMGVWRVEGVMVIVFICGGRREVKLCVSHSVIFSLESWPGVTVLPHE